MTILESGKRALDELEHQKAQTVMVTVNPPDLYMELLESYLMARPEVRVLQPAQTGHTPEQQLINHETDVVISTPAINNPLIEWRLLLREDLYLLVPQGHPLESRKMLRLSDIGKLPFITTAPGTPFRELTDTFFQHAGFVPNITYEVNELAMIRKTVELGLGVALFPASAFLRVSKGGPPHTIRPLPGQELRAVRITHPICEREIGIYRLRQGTFSGAAAEFYNFVIHYFEILQNELRQLRETL